MDRRNINRNRSRNQNPDDHDMENEESNERQVWNPLNAPLSSARSSAARGPNGFAFQMASASTGGAQPSNNSRKHARDSSNDDDDNDNDDDSADQQKKHASKKRKNSGRNESKNNRNQRDPLSSLLQRLRQYYEGAGPDSDSQVDVRMARHLLEASSGNVELAAALYLEDVLADGDAVNREYASNRDSNANGTGREAGLGTDGNPVARRRSNEGEDDVAHEERPIRRRLGEEFAAMEPPEDEEIQDDGLPPVEANEEAAAAVDPEDDVDEEDGAQENSVSVSDDEGAISERWRALHNGETRRSRSGVRNQRRIVSGNVVDDEAEASDKAEEKDSDYFSDDDWLLDDADDSDAKPQAPIEVLWGTRLSDYHEGRVTSAGNRSNTNNIIADDDPSTDTRGTAIPPAWLNAGFSMSSCGTGLAVKAPTEEEISLLRWRQQQNQRDGGTRSMASPPYHCRGISALHSLVTAVMYSGATIQGDEVNCNSAKKPFAELSKEDKKKEFDSRLADALSALILIAVKSSIDRKKKALAKRYKDLHSDKEDLDKRRRQLIERRLRLCPTCRWEEDQNTGEVRIPDGRDAGQQVSITASFTGIHDIKNYVRSNMRSFTGKGGCALFLETIMRIHGKNSVARMIRQERQNMGSRTLECGLIRCTCEERQNVQTQQSTHEPSRGYECVGVELLSLLLTGQVHTNFKGWAAGGLGIGMLSNESCEVGSPLKRPSRPTWILRGDTCYSALWLQGNEGVDYAASVAKTDCPGNAFKLAHWNCWYGLRNLSGMSVITHRGKWDPPSKTDFPTSYKRKSATDLILASRRQELSNVVSADESEKIIDSDCPSLEEVEKILTHPEDVEYYPDEYHRWRFDMGSLSESDKQKVGQQGWIPYFRLNTRQKLAVEMKLAPSINRILWKRWPQATIKITPTDDPPPIV